MITAIPIELTVGVATEYDAEHDSVSLVGVFTGGHGLKRLIATHVGYQPKELEALDYDCGAAWGVKVMDGKCAGRIFDCTIEEVFR